MMSLSTVNSVLFFLFAIFLERLEYAMLNEKFLYRCVLLNFIVDQVAGPQKMVSWMG